MPDGDTTTNQPTVPNFDGLDVSWRAAGPQTDVSGLGTEPLKRFVQ